MKMKNRSLTKNQSKRIIRILIICLALLLTWYIASRFMRLVSGPSLVTFIATSSDEEYPAFLNIQGITKNTETLLVNNYPVVPAVDGGFEYTYIAQPGYSTITLQAFDKFDNQTTKTLSLYTDEPPDSTEVNTTPSLPTEDTDVESEESLETNNS